MEIENKQELKDLLNAMNAGMYAGAGAAGDVPGRGDAAGKPDAMGSR